MTERTSLSAGETADADMLPSEDSSDVGATAWVAGESDANDGGGDGDVDTLVVEIEETRLDMADTVEAIGDRLDPANVAARARESVRDATIGTLQRKVNDVTTTAGDLASDAGRTAQQAGSGVVETIKANPIPAAMAGLGIGWLVMNRRRAQTWSGSWSSSSQWNGPDHGGYRHGPDARREPAGVGPGLRVRTDDAARAVSDAATQAQESAREVIDNVGDTAGRAAETVSRTTSDVVSQAQRAIESNPLAFGAIAVAVGAAVGIAIPATSAERRLMGDAGNQLIGKVESAVTQPLQEMETSGSR